MVFQGAWAPVMSWTLTFESGFIRRLSSVNRGTAADVTQLNTRYDYSVNYTLTDVASTFYVDKWINCTTTFPSPPAAFTADPNAATNAPEYQHTFALNGLQMHCG